MTVPVHDVAAEIRTRSGVNLTIMQVHKLLYFCQAHHLADLGEPMFIETISAWDNGPVVGSFWSMERNGIEPKNHAGLDQAQLNTVEYVLSRYGGLSGEDLGHITHAQAPWRLANDERERRGSKSVPITIEDLTDWFVGARERENEESGVDREQVREWLAEAPHGEPTRPHRMTSTGSGRCSRQMADGWKLVDFETRLRQWIEQDEPSDPQWKTAVRWVLALPDDPFAGASREMENLWFRVVPGTLDARSRMVACSFWIFVPERIVRCDNFKLLTYPFLAGAEDPWGDLIDPSGDEG